MQVWLLRAVAVTPRQLGHDHPVQAMLSDDSATVFYCCTICGVVDSATWPGKPRLERAPVPELCASCSRHELVVRPGERCSCGRRVPCPLRCVCIEPARVSMPAPAPPAQSPLVVRALERSRRRRKA
jgi:hypothetical protein